MRSGSISDIIESNLMPKTSGKYIFLVISHKVNDPDFQSETSGLQSQQYIIKTLSTNGNEICLIIGGDEYGLLYAAYRFLEYNGIRFYLHGDVIPDEKADIMFPKVEIIGKPLFALRSYNPFMIFHRVPTVDTDDYKAIIAQLPKMGMNFIGFHTHLPKRNSNGWEKAEPIVWIGEKEDVNNDGTVKSAYPALHANTGDWTWGMIKKKTSDFSFGSVAVV